MRNKIHSFRIKIVQLLFAIVCAISYHNHVEFIEKKTIRAGDQQKRLIYLNIMFFVNWSRIPFPHIFQTPKTMIKVTQENYAYKFKPAHIPGSYCLFLNEFYMIMIANCAYYRKKKLNNFNGINWQKTLY
jgi:hypothetical protein